MKTLFKIQQNDRNRFISKVVDSSAPRTDFYFLVVLSTLIVAFGLASNNLILIIGGMLVTPLLSPILAIALGVVTKEKRLTWRSIRIFLISVCAAILISFIVGMLSKVYVYRIELIGLMKPSIFSFIIAVVAGLAASYSWAKPGLDQVLPGVAITVTIIPPITALGLVLAEQSWFLFFMILQYLILNIFGIIIASLVVFLAMEFYRAKRRASEEIVAEAKKLAK